MLSQRRGDHPPSGLSGGESGQLGRNQILRAGETEAQELGGSFDMDVQAGDQLIIETPGGGGFGRVPPVR